MLLTALLIIEHPLSGRTRSPQLSVGIRDWTTIDSRATQAAAEPISSASGVRGFGGLRPGVPPPSVETLARLWWLCRPFEDARTLYVVRYTGHVSGLLSRRLPGMCLRC